MDVRYVSIGVCGLSCRLCPNYHIKGRSRCGGCKSEIRMSAGCPFITCAIKKREIEFCWDCMEAKTCDKWRKHIDFSRQYDTFKCYQKLENNISFIQENGVDAFDRTQRVRESLLREMLQCFNEGRSKAHYCIAATVLEVEELKKVLSDAKERSKNLSIREKALLLRSMLRDVSEKKSYHLKLRK